MGTSWQFADVSRPLLHEDIQVGYVVQCPNCGAEITLPIREFLEDQPMESWQVPPQNAALAALGWYSGWGGYDDTSSLHLRHAVPVPRGDHVPSRDSEQFACNRRAAHPTDPGVWITSGCGKAYVVEHGTLREVG